MKICDLLNYFEQTAPLSSQADWDNSGLLVGDASASVSKVLVCLDVTADELSFALEQDCELIVSHHPVIFRAKKNFTAGDIPFEAAKCGISVISLHTNLDKAQGGVNDVLCERLGLTFEKIPAPVCDGFLNIAYIEGECEVAEFASHIKEKLGGTVQYVEGKKTVSKLGICSGAGSDFISEAQELGCDGFVTGEAGYHDFIDAKASGMSLFAAGHFETEVPVVSALARKLRNEFNDIEVLEMPAFSVIKTE